MTPRDWLLRYAQKSERMVLGLMSGTSADGIDAALVHLSGSGRATRASLRAFAASPFPHALRERILRISHGKGDAGAVSRLHADLGGAFADAAAALLEESGVPRADLDAVASHGQTVSHTPDAGATLQLGSSARLAQRLGVPVVSDFRSADIAAGGQGAPLIPYADWCLLTRPDRSRAVQNIGGIGNVTYLPADAAPERVIGFDTGPGNMLIDRAASWASGGAWTCDRDGALAAQGAVDDALLAWLLEHPFLRRTPPRSAGREEFGEAFWEKALARASGRRPVDLLATLTSFTARSVAGAYAFLPAPPDEVIVGGGGARNPALMRLLAQSLAPIPVRTHEAVGLDGDAKEALAFALLANETLLGNPSSLPSVTGAARSVLLGTIAFP